MLNRTQIPEMCQDEIKDFLLGLVRKELKNLPADENCRKKDLCEAVLAVNREKGERQRLFQSAGEILKDWKAQEAQIAALEKLGFTVIKGRKHYKMRFRELPYQVIISASPSDKRSGANNISELEKLFF